MREWADRLSDWMQEREEIDLSDSSLEGLAEEVFLAAQETSSLLQASDQLESIYAQLLRKTDHVNS
ncbi:MAG: hypothetical protein V4487_05370 [Chlamydiota bacterium]